MTISRRSMLGAAACALALASVPRPARAQSGPRAPNPADFESGDLLWPKKPGSVVLYQYESGAAAEEDANRWNREKAEFLAKVREGRINDGQRIAREIADISYNDFRARYLRNRAPNEITTFSGGGLAAVGHVGIVELDAEGEPWIIEALWEPGVVRQKYSSWISARAGEIVWHGRLKDVGRQDRAKIALEARKHVSKPYDFWNFDLSDTSAFYCSKLVWLCAMRAINVAVDGNPNPARSIWLSPKQILYSPPIVRLLDPGDYAID